METATEELRELVARTYQEHQLEIIPMFPKVLVRQLPREQVTKGGLYLPDEGKQNKPTSEGIVLQTYEPFWQTVGKLPDNFDVKDKNLLLDKENVIRKVWQESIVKPGDHILYPHMAVGITPVWPLDDGKGFYKLIPEYEIVARLSYDKEPLKDWLKSFVAFRDIDELVSDLLSKADIIRKDIKAVSISGR